MYSVNRLLLIIAFAFPLYSVAQEEAESAEPFKAPEIRELGIYNSSGKKIYYVTDTGRTQERSTIEGQRRYPERMLTDVESGQTYTYSHVWDQTTSNGAVFMKYHFNKRQWYWVEGKGIQLGGSVKGESIRRTYKNKGGVLTTTEQGGYPILSLKDSKYVNEFGEPVYSLVGAFPEWCMIILVHKYYDQVYLSDAIDEINSRRAAIIQ